MSEAEQREFEPIVAEDGSITIRSPVADELGQDFIAYYDRRRTTASHPSISPVDSAAIQGTKPSDVSDAGQLIKHSPSFAVLDEAQRILQRAWKSLTQLVSDRGSDLEPLPAITSSPVSGGGGGGAITASAGGDATFSELHTTTSSTPPAAVPSASSLSDKVSNADAEGGNHRLLPVLHQLPCPHNLFQPLLFLLLHMGIPISLLKLHSFQHLDGASSRGLITQANLRAGVLWRCETVFSK